MMRHVNTQSVFYRVVIMATGYSEEKKENFPGMEYVKMYGDISVNPDDYEGKSVLILGMEADTLTY